LNEATRLTLLGLKIEDNRKPAVVSLPIFALLTIPLPIGASAPLKSLFG
jgi:hypothetical protein